MSQGESKSRSPAGWRGALQCSVPSRAPGGLSITIMLAPIRVDSCSSTGTRRAEHHHQVGHNRDWRCHREPAPDVRTNGLGRPCMVPIRSGPASIRMVDLRAQQECDSRKGGKQDQREEIGGPRSRRAEDGGSPEDRSGRILSLSQASLQGEGQAPEQARLDGPIRSLIMDGRWKSEPITADAPSGTGDQWLAEAGWHRGLGQGVQIPVDQRRHGPAFGLVPGVGKKHGCGWR